MAANQQPSTPNYRNALQLLAVTPISEYNTPFPHGIITTTGFIA